MESPPTRLMIDPHATPTIHHSPIPVPLHWQSKVKASLDRDIRLGVLEPVPIGNQSHGAIEWTSAPKKNDTPRRTIDRDFQPLNIHATREIHHTQLPFHQARSVPKGRKKGFSTHGMATTVYPFILKTDTTPCLLLLGAATDTVQPHKVTWPQVTETPGDTTRSPHSSQTKPDA